MAKAQESCRRFVHCIVLVLFFQVLGKGPLFASFIYGSVIYWAT